MDSNWACANASGCSGSSRSVFASPGPFWPEQIQRGRKGIKKLRGLMVDDTVDLWALDQVHFQQQGSRCRMWVPPEAKDPVVYHHPTRKSVGYFAAVHLRDGEFLFRRETGRCNGETFWEFLKVFREASTVPDRRVLAISDNAQYHRSKLHRGGATSRLPSSAWTSCRPIARI